MVLLQTQIPWGLYGCRYHPGLCGVHAMRFGQVCDDTSECSQLGLLQHVIQSVERKHVCIVLNVLPFYNTLLDAPTAWKLLCMFGLQPHLPNTFCISASIRNKHCMCVCVSSSLKGAGFPLHLLPKCVPSGSLAGKTCSQWHGIPAGTPVGAALGDFQCSVYSCMSERTDAGETGYPFISLNELNTQCSHSWLWICIY